VFTRVSAMKPFFVNVILSILLLFLFSEKET